MTAARFFVILCCASSLLCACEEPASAGRGDDAAVGEAEGSVELASQEAPLLALSVAGLEGGASSPEEAALMTAQGLPEEMTQPGCVSVTTEDNVNTYVFDGCQGPYGLVGLEGALVVTYGVDGLAVTALVESDGLSINSVEVAISAQVVYQPGRQEQTLSATLRATVSGERGRSADFSGALTLRWEEDEGCAALDGELSSTRERRAATTTISGLAWCEEMCPEAGGEVRYADGAGNTVVVSLDGSAEASWTLTTSGGQERQGTLALDCAP